jgi:hypothetical protein
MLGTLSLRDRVFEVSLARIARAADGTWYFDIETEPREYDGEEWAPYLYHQGLRLKASRVDDLVRESSVWHHPTDPDYPHPEPSLIYVFGHHYVYDATLSFTGVRDGRISMVYSGRCEVFWDEVFSDDVPFECRCLLEEARDQ